MLARVPVKGVACGKLNAVGRGLLSHCSGKFAFQPERVIGCPSCDTAQCPWKIISLE